jgi:hypothetical protein
MALFDWLKFRFWKNRSQNIPENIFLEKPVEESSSDVFHNSKSEHNYDLTSNVLGVTYDGQLIQGIDSVHLFITIDLDKKGYNDALTNPDSSNLKDNLKLLYYDLTIVIERALSYYDEKIKELEAYYKSRNNLGLTDLADEIATEKNKILELVEKVKKIEEEATRNEGKGQRMLLSYEIGFKRGLAALTASKLFPKNNGLNNNE